MNHPDYLYYHEIINILLKVHSIKQCPFHPDSYIKIKDYIPKKAYAYGANYLKRNQSIGITFKEFASLIKSTYDLLTEVCYDCNQLEKD